MVWAVLLLLLLVRHAGAEDTWLLHTTDGHVCWRGEGAFVPPKYDFTKSTEENHKAGHMRFVGPFAALRARRDYSYHSNYREARQHMQDCIVQLLLRTDIVDAGGVHTCDRPHRAWLVFTAGAMGAGKSHVLRWLWQQELFPLEAFVQSNPDQIRRMLPETARYLERDQLAAGTLTHKEAGYVAELVTEAALEHGKNVVVDGSLRNATWYADFIDKVRSEHPRLQIAILHVTASPQAVLARASRRAGQTGRAVPLHVLLDTLKSVPASVARLRPLVDYAVEIENEGAEPVLRTFGETWETLRGRFTQRCAAALEGRGEVPCEHAYGDGRGRKEADGCPRPRPEL